MSAVETVVEDAIYYLPRTTIHPDPDQPRLSPDAELQASIDSEGIIQPIIVRPHPELENEWILVDGERRWRGGDHLKTIPCRIRLDLEEPVDRLITQLSANNSKPLSPVEQALAFKKILDDDPKLSQAELAKRLGIPRSTIGDRIRLTDLHPVWLKMFGSGELQPSHAPVLHRLAGVPAKYQVEAAAKAKASYWWGENMQIDDFICQIEDVFKPYIHPLQKGPYGGGPEFDAKKYEGPTVQVREGMRGSKTILYAADPEIWKPLVNAARAEKSKKTREMRKSGAESITRRGKKVKIDVPEGTPTKKLRGYRHKEPGHIQLTGWQGKWEIENGSRYDPAVLLERLDRSKLVVMHGDSDTEIWTSDTDAFSVARSQWETRWAARREDLRQETAGIVEKMPPVVPSGDASRKLIEHLLSGRASNGLGDLQDMAAIAKVPLSKKLTLSSFWNEQEDEADRWISKLTNAEATQCLRALLSIYYLAPEGPTARVENEEREESNRLRSHVSSFFPEMQAKQIADAKATGKPIDGDLEEEDDFSDALDERSPDAVEEEQLEEVEA